MINTDFERMDWLKCYWVKLNRYKKILSKSLRGVAQFGQSARFGSERSRVQISVPRLQNGVDLVTHFPHKEGYVGSNPTSATVTVADLVMHRIVVPDYAGSNPVSHLKGLIYWGVPKWQGTGL